MGSSGSIPTIIRDTGKARFISFDMPLSIHSIFGDMRIPDSIGAPGNVIVFRGPDREVEFKNVEWVSLPTLREQKKQEQRSAPPK